MHRTNYLLARTANLKYEPLRVARKLHSQTQIHIPSCHHDAHAEVISAIRECINNTALLSNFRIVDALRSSYRDFHLCQTPSSTGLRAFSRSGSLQASLDHSIDWYGSRVRRNSADKIETSDGLKDGIEFARYACRWNNQDFYIYSAEYWQNEWTHVSNHYILCPKQHAQVNHGRSTFADNLIIASLQHGAEVEEEIWLYDGNYWDRSSALWNSVKDCTWEDVILSQNLKEELIKDVSTFFDRKEYYKAFGVPWKRGLILHGLPGNGKTISIKAMMRSLNLRTPSIPTLYVKSLGSECSHSDIRSIFEKARQTAPCLLVLEDLDSLVTENVRSFFLNEVDGLEQNDGILMVGSTNYLDMLDVAISKRPSRFDRKYHFPLPAQTERARYCDFWRTKLTKNTSLSFPKELTTRIADITEGLSFAYLQEIFVSSMTAILTEHNDESAQTEAGSVSSIVNAHTIWQVISKQIEKIRKEMQDSRKSIDDASKNTVSVDAVSSSARPPGFGR